MSTRWYSMPDNYIYISHLGDNGKYFILPNYPDSIQDSLNSNFGSETALGRSAPVYTYSNSGPRTVQFSMDIHRDLMDSVNEGNTSVEDDTIDVHEVELDEDYLDKLIRALQAIAVPKYNLTNKLIQVPTVALRINQDIFIKGIVTGGVSVTYRKPLLTNGKYAHVQVSFQISETDPYDATTIEKNGSFRGLTKSMRAGFHLEEPAVGD